MENVPDLLAAAPGLAPGIILGLMGGVLYGLNEDRKADDGVPHRWWQTGAIGALLGGVAWMFILIGS